MKSFLLTAALVLCWQSVCLASGQKTNSPLKIIVSLDRMDDSETMTFYRVVCEIENVSQKTIRIIEPTAYSIEPHPWLERFDQTERRFWSGSEICAPDFMPEQIIELKPKEKRQYQLPFGMITIYKTKPPTYFKMAVGYSFKRKDTKLTKAMGKVKLKKVTEIETVWSNEIDVPNNQKLL